MAEQELIGRYQILRKIASGGMATVYAARVAGAAGFERLVALKRMLPEISGDERLQRMFLDEARVAANVRSPYVVSTLDLDHAQDGSLYIVMDLVIGCSLADILRGCNEQGRVLPTRVIAEILQQAARGLSDAHEACSALGEPLRIVHRDISPQNVLVGLDGATRITDFGVAQAVQRLTKTRGHSIKGKLAYCSPEQALGEPLDGRSDIFALGIVLWEALTQQRLFKGASTKETVDAVLQTPIVDPRMLRPDIEPRLAEVTMRCLERDPAARFQSALDLAEALRSAVPVPARVGDIRAIVKLIAGEQISEIVEDIREAIAETGSGSPFDDAPTEVDAPEEKVSRQTLASDTFRQITREGLLDQDPSLAAGELLMPAATTLTPPGGHHEAKAFEPPPASSTIPKAAASSSPIRWKLVLPALALFAFAGGFSFFVVGWDSTHPEPAAAPEVDPVPLAPQLPPQGEPVHAAPGPADNPPSESLNAPMDPAPDPLEDLADHLQEEIESANAQIEALGSSDTAMESSAMEQTSTMSSRRRRRRRSGMAPSMQNESEPSSVRSDSEDEAPGPREIQNPWSTMRAPILR